MYSAFFMGILLGMSIVIVIGKRINSERKLTLDKQKYQNQVKMLSQWIGLYQKDRLLKIWLDNNACKTVAIYGMGSIGQLLYKELQKSKVNVKYVIDNNIRSGFDACPLKTIKDNLDDVDIVIVTVVDEYQDIKRMLSPKVTGKIIAFDYMINDL